MNGHYHTLNTFQLAGKLLPPVGFPFFGSDTIFIAVRQLANGKYKIDSRFNLLFQYGDIVFQLTLRQKQFSAGIGIFMQIFYFTDNTAYNAGIS